MAHLTDADRLKLLMDYTKFHIGMYTTIITVLLGLIVIGVDQSTVKIPVEFRQPMFVISLFFSVAGGFAGMVAAPIPNHSGTFDEYWDGPSRIFGCSASKVPVRIAARCEHIAFWIAVVIGLVTVAVGGWSIL